MGFASYFERDIRALNNRFSQQTENQFKQILNDHIICIQIDDQFTSNKEADVFIELLVRIISRFYPKIMFRCTHPEGDKYIKRLKRLSKSINSNIEFGGNSDLATYTVIADKKYRLPKESIGIYSGSSGWTAMISKSKNQSFDKSNNPFGASIAACITASNIFRHVFYDQLGIKGDSDVSISTLDLIFNSEAGRKGISNTLDDVKLDSVDLVGVGAIGNATIWALSKIERLSGKLNIIDSEQLEKSNLQRYILFGEKDVDHLKVELAKRQLEKTGLTIRTFQETWGTYVQKYHKGKCSTRLVSVCVDSEIDRIYVQSSLPKKIINAYTDTNRFGITRHPDFINGVCLSCIYKPSKVQKSKIEKLLDGLGLNFHDKSMLDLVYHYMNKVNPIDERFLQIFCKVNNLPLQEFEKYKGRPLGELYSDAARCGVKPIELRNANQQIENIDVPLSFQSCMVGVILAAEIIIESIGNINSTPDSSIFNILDPIEEGNNPIHISRIKNENGNCICGDHDYQRIYKEKWS